MDKHPLRLAEYEVPPAPLPFDDTPPIGRPASPELPESAERVLDALACMSRRIDDLARELNCVVNDGGDGSRAA